MMMLIGVNILQVAIVTSWSTTIHHHHHHHHHPHAGGGLGSNLPWSSSSPSFFSTKRYSSQQPNKSTTTSLSSTSHEEEAESGSLTNNTTTTTKNDALLQQQQQQQQQLQQLPLPTDMKLKEIKDELQDYQISYMDCFDRESLITRLLEARDENERKRRIIQNEIGTDREEEVSKTETHHKKNDQEEKEEEDNNSATKNTTDFDRSNTLRQLRSLRVSELKLQLSNHKVRWGNIREKEELVQSLCHAMEERYYASQHYSRSGLLVPGMVTDIQEEWVLLQELGWSRDVLDRGMVPTRSTTTTTTSTTATPSKSSPSTSSPFSFTSSSSSSEKTKILRPPPILLDVYATWCGPCKFMTPILDMVAEEVGPKIRIMKLDSDKFPRLSSLLKVGGLPTLIRFDIGQGEEVEEEEEEEDDDDDGVLTEVQRIEGALNKDQLMEFIHGKWKR